MIKLTSKELKDSSEKHLLTIQTEILGKDTFRKKAETAIKKWDNKTSGLGKDAFADVKTVLIEMCVGVEICVYCEQNEATDIEHIYPKKLYPEKAFNWSNYVLACGKCNTHHKSDKFKIFNPEGSETVQDVTPPRGVYSQPNNDDALFINQRINDPMEYLELDLVNRQFIFTEKADAGTREFEIAKYTKDLLGLNTRASLVANRKNAAKFYLSRLERYVHALNSTTFAQLAGAIDDTEHIDVNGDFDLEKDRVLSSIKLDVLGFHHPTVWRELVRQRENLPKTKELFTHAPEALEWKHSTEPNAD
ncbi:MAG: HNH endonuclease [Dyadobacter fermentans]